MLDERFFIHARFTVFEDKYAESFVYRAVGLNGAAWGVEKRLWGKAN
jgi:hypothetical protein